MLLPNHIIKSLLESRYSSNYHLSIEKLTSKQRLKVKGPIIDVNNRLNGVFNSFNPFNNKFSPRNRLIDMFPSWFSFYPSDRKSVEIQKSHLCKLNKIIFNASNDPKTVIVISDASIKNHVITSIAYVHMYNSPVIKTIHHTINVTSTEVELFIIRCGLIQVIQLTNIKSRLQLSLRKLGSFSKEIVIIPLNFGITLVKTNSHFMILLTKKPRDSIYYLYSLANLHGTSVKRMNVTISQTCGK